METYELLKRKVEEVADDMAKAFGGYGERVTQPDDIKAAIKRGIEQTQSGTPALLEFITSKETRVSKF